MKNVILLVVVLLLFFFPNAIYAQNSNERVLLNSLEVLKDEGVEYQYWLLEGDTIDIFIKDDKKKSVFVEFVSLDNDETLFETESDSISKKIVIPSTGTYALYVDASNPKINLGNIIRVGRTKQYVKFIVKRYSETFLLSQLDTRVVPVPFTDTIDWKTEDNEVVTGTNTSYHYDQASINVDPGTSNRYVFHIPYNATKVAYVISIDQKGAESLQKSLVSAGKKLSSLPIQSPWVQASALLAQYGTPILFPVGAEASFRLYSDYSHIRSGHKITGVCEQIEIKPHWNKLYFEIVNQRSALFEIGQNKINVKIGVTYTIETDKIEYYQDLIPVIETGTEYLGKFYFDNEAKLEEYWESAEKSFANRMYADAIEKYKALLNMGYYTGLLSHLSQALMFEGHYKDALTFAKRYVKEYPDDRLGKLNLGFAYLLNNDPTNAKKIFISDDSEEWRTAINQRVKDFKKYGIDSPLFQSINDN